MKQKEQINVIIVQHVDILLATTSLSCWKRL